MAPVVQSLSSSPPLTASSHQTRGTSGAVTSISSSSSLVTSSPTTTTTVNSTPSGDIENVNSKPKFSPNEKSAVVEEGWGGNELDELFDESSDEEPVKEKLESPKFAVTAISQPLNLSESTPPAESIADEKVPIDNQKLEIVSTPSNMESVSDVLSEKQENAPSADDVSTLQSHEDILSYHNLLDILSEGKLVLFARTGLFTRLLDLLLFLTNVDIGARIERTSEERESLSEFRLHLIQSGIGGSEYSPNTGSATHVEEKKSMAYFANLLCLNVCLLVIQGYFLQAGIAVLLHYRVHSHFFALNSAFYLLPRFIGEELKRLEVETDSDEVQFPNTLSIAELRSLCSTALLELNDLQKSVGKNESPRFPTRDNSNRNIGETKAKSFMDDWL
jgi:hypothetical protein